MNWITCLLAALVFTACEGPAGPIGPQGPAGPQGEKGDRGDPGQQGEVGTEGPKGEKGDRGDQGTQGPTGEQGPKGEAGVQGDQGEKGDRGEPGFSGVTAFSFVEVTLGSRYYEQDRGRFVIEDERIRPETVIEVYMKFFYTDTGTPYYIPFQEAVEASYYYHRDIYYSVDDHNGGRLVIYDSSEQLAGENISVMVTGTSDEQDDN